MLKVTLPGFCAVDVIGDPPGKTQEYWAAVEVVLKLTEAPASIITSEAGDVIIPTGGAVA